MIKDSRCMTEVKIALLTGGAIGMLSIATPAAAQAVGAPGHTISPDYEDYTDLTKHDLFYIYPNFDLENPQWPTVDVQGMQCTQMLDPIIQSLDIGGAGIEFTGLILEVAGSLVGGLPESLTIGTQAAGFFTRGVSLALNEYQFFSGAPDCNTDFLGGVKVTGGGINVSGNSVVAGALGIGGELSVAGSLYAGSTLDTGGALSAYNGLITLGVRDRIGVQDGISIGGGSIGGAGHMGPEAFSMHATSLAIGNGSLAAAEGSIALGTYAVSAEFGGVAVGYDANAGAARAVAVGNLSQAMGIDSVAIGHRSSASDGAAVAVGNLSEALGLNSVAIGNQSSASNGAAVAIGYLSAASGNGAVAIGDPNVATGRGAVAIGADNTATGEAALAFGADNVATGIGAQAIGFGASATGTGALAYGNGAGALANGSIAIGAGANAGFVGSVAIGPGATASRDGQIVLGSASATVTMPGIASANSRAAQSGPVSFVTADLFGNLATDGGAVAGSTLINRQGVALGIAMQNPDLTGDENSGISFNWGEFEGAEAYSLSGAVVVARNIFGEGKNGRVALTGSVGISGAVTDNRFRMRVNESVATRIGGQITW